MMTEQRYLITPFWQGFMDRVWCRFAGGHEWEEPEEIVQRRGTPHLVPVNAHCRWCGIARVNGKASRYESLVMSVDHNGDDA